MILRHSGIARGNRSCCSTVRGPHRAGCRFSAHLLLQWYLGTALLRQFWNCVVWCMGCVHSVLHGVPLHRCDNRNCEDACCVRFFKLFLSGTLAVLAATYSTRANKKVALSSSGLLMSTAGTQSHSKGT